MTVQPTRVPLALHSGKSWRVQKLILIWIPGLLIILPPVIAYTKQSKAVRDVCLFNETGFLYTYIWYPIVFLLVVIIIPLAVTIASYSSIFHHVKLAEKQRWLNQLRILIQQMRPRTIITDQTMNSSQQEIQIIGRKLDKEKQIALKGLFAVLLLVLFWLPFSISWLVLTANRHLHTTMTTSDAHVYLIILAKFSVAGNIICYIVCSTKFNVHFKRVLLSPCLGYRAAIMPVQPSTTRQLSLHDRSVISCPPAGASSHTNSIAATSALPNHLVTLNDMKDAATFSPASSWATEPQVHPHPPPFIKAVSFPVNIMLPLTNHRHNVLQIEPLPNDNISESSFSTESDNDERITQKTQNR